ncbi:MAG: patatin-like phospholipase family protein [Candidatus Acidiferrales bacterium]
MKHILSLDGGGIRGVFTLEILLRIQQLLREHAHNPQLMLADHFEFIAGTSTGAMIATALSWGMDAQTIMDVYEKHGKAMFQPVPWYRPLRRMFVSKYEARPLTELLQKTFSEDDEGKVPALLSTSRLRTYLLVVVRNQTTGSAWPLTNNPKAIYNDPTLPDCNLNIPLWKVVRASTAAPVYFDPEQIMLGDKLHVFVDGGITPYNNPALIAALTAVLPCYNIKWEPGAGKIRLISIGATRFSTAAFETTAKQMWLGFNLPRIPAALIQGISLEQDYICRCLGECLYGEPVDSEIGDLVGLDLPGPKWFSYVRYNRSFLGKEAQALVQAGSKLAKLDDVAMIRELREIGRAYAEKHVRLEHLI